MNKCNFTTTNVSELKGEKEMKEIKFIGTNGNTNIYFVENELQEVKRAFQASYDYLKDRYGITHSYSTFEKNCLKKGFANDEQDFDLIIMTTLVGMGKFDAAFEEANFALNQELEDVYRDLEHYQDMLAEEVTKFTKLTLIEKIKFVWQAFKETVHKFRK